MICENCDKRSAKGACDKCLVYENLANYSKHISNAFYNRGLVKAQNRDISGAIKDLEKSITYDCDNYYARNLIGLCYYELGMFGEASKNWFLSAYNDFEDNIVQKFIDEIGEELAKNKNYVRSIEMYNLALEKIQAKEIVAAYTLLIEATSSNPKLVPALNLLSFLHLLQGQKENAIPIIDRVLAIDSKNEQALYYYTVATQNKYRPNQNNVKKMPTQAEVVEEKNNIVDKNRTIIYIIIAVACTAIVTVLLTNMFSSSSIAYDELDLKYKESLASSKEAADNFAKTITEKDVEISSLTTEKQELESQLQVYKNVENLADAKKMFDAKNYEEVASKLYQVDKSTLSEENLKEYETMANVSFEKAIKSLYNSGYKKFGEEDYVDSKSDLISAYLYCDKVDVDEELEANIVYYLARNFEALEDYSSAQEYYNILLDKYPNNIKDTEERVASFNNV